ncbi:MAG: polysaccharide deacetylase family protein [Magnetococcus sp. DMHC-8]
MMTLTAAIRLMMGLFALVCSALPASLATGEPSPASEHVARYGAMPFDGQHLYPDGGVAMSAAWLSRPEERIMVLTFDDGPDDRDLQIVDLLQQHRATATFFYIGRKAKAMPTVVEAVRTGRHAIGYHSYRHQQMSWLSRADLVEDFRQGKAVMAALGVTVTWFRPPYGDFNDRVVRSAKEQGMETILWTIDSRDWAGIGAREMADNVIRQFQPGAILLFHSTRAASLQALPALLRAAEQAHYRFVSLDEWLQIVQAANCRMTGQFCSSSPLAGEAAAPAPSGAATTPAR